MRICFDRLCFARERPAPNENIAHDNNATFQPTPEQQLHTYSSNASKPTSTTNAPTNQSVITTSPCATTKATTLAPQPQNTSASIATKPIATYRSVATLGPTDGASINALDPPSPSPSPSPTPTPTSTINNNRNTHKVNSLDLADQRGIIGLFGNSSALLNSQRSEATTTIREAESESKEKKTTPTPNINILEKQSTIPLWKAEIFPASEKAPDSSQTTSAAATDAVDAAASDAAKHKQKESEDYSHKTFLADVELRQDNVSNEEHHNHHPRPRPHSHQPQSVADADNDDVANSSESSATEAAESSAKMQQEPNANIQFQPDLGLVNNNNLQALGGTLIDQNTGAIRLSLPLNQTDLFTHTLIYGTVPTGAQQLNTDPNLQARNYLQQQELQLQQRYQQLQQLQAQTQGLFASAPSTTPIILQPTASATSAGAVYANTPTDFCTQQKLLAAQMQGLCISTPNSTAPAVNAGAVMDPTAGGGFNLHNSSSNSSYVPATAQEERLLQCIQAKDLKIQEMQRALQYKDNEIAELKSHLDKFQSVFPFSRSGATTPCGGVSSCGGSSIAAAAGGVRKSGQSFQRQRAQGISAEPQSESSVLLNNVTFPKYDKDDK